MSSVSGNREDTMDMNKAENIDELDEQVKGFETLAGINYLTSGAAIALFAQSYIPTEQIESFTELILAFSHAAERMGSVHTFRLIVDAKKKNGETGVPDIDLTHLPLDKSGLN